MPTLQHRFIQAVIVRPLLVFCLVAMLLPGIARSQERYSEEIVVNFRVPRLLNQDIFVLYDGKTIYVPLSDVFSLLGIRAQREKSTDKFSGYIFSKDQEYQIDPRQMRASCYGQEHRLDSTDFFLSATDIYLRVDLYEQIFKLRMAFNFSELSLFLPYDEDFPAYQKLQRELAHKNLKRSVEKLKDIQPIERERKYIGGAVADWTLSANPAGENRVHYYGLNLGGMLLGGDFTLNGTGNTQTGIEADQLSYRWRLALNDNPYLTQVKAGDVYTGGTYGRSIKGVQLTNQPTVNRKYFQTIMVSDYVGEGWEVELFVNNRLVDFTHTDQSGRYEFLVDVNYGSSFITLKMYGPNGELRTEEQYVRTPFTLVPKNTVEYSASVGEQRYGVGNRRYAQVNGYYGLLRNLTLGINTDIPLSPPDEEESRVAVEANFQAMGDLLLNASYSPGYAASASANYSRPSSVSLAAGYTRYFENELHNIARQIHAITFSSSYPLRLGGRIVGLRYFMTHLKYPSYRVTNMSYGVTTSIKRFQLSYFGQFRINQNRNYSTRIMTSRLFVALFDTRLFSPRFTLEYHHTYNEVQKYGVSVSQRLFRTGRLSLAFERVVPTGANQITVSFDLYNSFATFATRATRVEDRTSVSQIQHGSVQYDHENKTVRFDRRNRVGYGAAVVRPFLDGNYNGEYDEGEEYLSGLQARVQGAGGRPHGPNRLYYYDRLRPYDEYMVKIEPSSLDNPLLKPAHENYKVAVNPNMVTSIEVPLVLGGEVSGRVKRIRTQDSVGMGGIRVMLVNLTTESVTELRTFNSGEFYYLGLIPGQYEAYIDPTQLKELGYECEPGALQFEMDPSKGLDIVDNLAFHLTAPSPDTGRQ